MLPEGWRTASVGEVCETVSVGIVVNPSHYYVAENEGTRAFRSGNVRENRVLDDKWVYLSEEGHAKNRKSQLREGDVLVVRTGAAGTACVMPSQYAGSNCIDILFARPDQTQVLPEFLAQLTNSEVGRRQILAGQSGLAQKHLNVATYAAMQFGLPPVFEQRRIAAILSTWDATIAAAERILANSHAHLSGVLEKTVLTPTRRGQWPLQRIDTVADRVLRQNQGDEQLPVLMISSGSGFVRQDEKYARYMAGKSVQNYIALRAGEFAYNKGNSKRYEFGCVFPLKNCASGLVPHVYVCFRLHDGLHAAFYEHLFAADYLHDQLGALVNTGVRNNGLLNIGPADFLGCMVPVPPVDTQIRVASILDAGVALIRKHEQFLGHLREEKAAIMADLLTGKRRVSLADAETMP